MPWPRASRSCDGIQKAGHDFGEGIGTVDADEMSGFGDDAHARARRRGAHRHRHIDGRTGLVGSDEAGLRGAIAQAREAGPAIPATLSRDGDRIAAQVGAGRGTARVLLIGYDPRHTTRVLHGENAGRTIEQANIVRSIHELGRWSGTAATFTAALPEGETAALLVQAEDGRILGAARLDRPGAATDREALR